MIKHGSYARPAQIWLRRVTDYADFTQSNAREVSALLQRDNRAGLYDQVLRQMCNIQAALVDNAEHHAEYDMDLLKPLWRITKHTAPNTMRRFVDKAAPADRTLDGYAAWLEAEGKRMLKIGMFGIKMICFDYKKPNPQAADAAFAKLANGPSSMAPQDWRVLRCAAQDRLMGFAREHGLTVACHSGVWGDFRDSHPCHLIPLAQAHPDVHFDLFHLGTPFVREAVMVGKMFPNVSLNLCWNTVVSPAQTARMLDECIDLVPMNNIIAFGGDYRITVEKVYGHLIMAKEVVARVLAKRIQAGLMDQPDAIRVAKLWFHDNAMDIYGLR